MEIDDVDLDMPVSVGLFDLSPANFAWRPPIPQEIEQRRALMSDLLIFDILLSSGGIRPPDSLYPPTDEDSLQHLLDAIINSTFDALKQDSLIYYLLKWCQDGREESFKMDRCISPQFAALADAYWHLDSGIDVSKAVSLLSDARLNREYTSKILQALSLAENAEELIRKYVRTAKPLLTEPPDIDTYTIALADSSLMEAWQYQATFAESSRTRERLIHHILDWCLIPTPRPVDLKQLLAFPFSPYEQSLVHAYAIGPPQQLPPASVAAIQDLVCLRLIQHGQYAAAIKLDRHFPVARKGSEAQKAAQERKAMLDEFVAVMPLPERQLLEVELEELAQSKPAALAASGSGESLVSRMGSSSGLSMSWESVRAQPAVSGSASTVRARLIEPPVPAIPHRSGAPRFGGPLPGKSTTNDDALPPLIPTPYVHHPAQPLFSAFPPPGSGTGVPHAGPSGQRMVQNSPRAQSSTARPMSLFDVAGSANQAPNAFYKPPPSLSLKRPFGQDSARPIATAPSPAPVKPPPPPAQFVEEAEEAGDDVVMHADEGGPSPVRAERLQLEQPGVSAEFSVSVFSPPNTSKPRSLARNVSEQKMPPGAFIPDTDEESEPERPPPRRAPPPRTPSPPPARMRSSRKSTAAKEPHLAQSIPGGLMDEEEEDVVAPLPPRRPARKSRASKSVNQDEAEDTTRPRRSTRLSTVSSVGSSSPEPPSPQKPAAKTKKTTRTSAAGTATATRSSTRKKH